jgi:hypothetical protein
MNNPTIGDVQGGRELKNFIKKGGNGRLFLFRYRLQLH